jgi:cysteine desulfurase
MIADLEIYGNASSMHEDGRNARVRIEEARHNVAALIGANANNIVWTSGGSESNNTVFASMRELAAKDGRNEFITTTIEHPCVLNSAAHLKSLGYKVHFIGVDSNGKLDMDAFKAALSERVLLVSVMMANNELGVIEDIAEISKLAKNAGALVHSDAVQAAGKIQVDVNKLGVDYLTLSCHKIYGPKGVGALYHKNKAPLLPLIHGGHQEDGIRAGTYNNLGILGFGKAAELALKGLEEYQTKLRALRQRLCDGITSKIPNIKINGHTKDVLPNTLNVSFPGAEGEAILLSLDLEGIAVSTGSACASGSLDPSHVLMAIGVGPELAHSSIRFSMGLGTTELDIDYVLEKLPPIIARLRAMSSVTGK